MGAIHPEIGSFGKFVRVGNNEFKIFVKRKDIEVLLFPEGMEVT